MSDRQELIELLERYAEVCKRDHEYGELANVCEHIASLQQAEPEDNQEEIHE